MKFLRRQNLNSSSILDKTVLQSADGNVELNPTQRVIVRGDILIEGDLFVPNGVVPGPETTNTMYVTVDGNDNNSGFGEGPRQAKRSIKAAVDAAQQGTTIFVRSGEYYENNPVRIPPKVSIVGDNLRRVIIRPLNGPKTFNIVSIERTDKVTTITSDTPHGLKAEDRIRVRCSITDVNETDVNIIDVPTPTTLRYRQIGADVVSTSASGVFKWAPDLFLVNSQNYLTGLVFKGLQAPAYCVNIDDDAIVDTSPYVQNCSNINGPWMRNGEEWLPFVTKQPNLAGTMVTGPRPLLDDEIDSSQVDVYGIDVEGAGGGMLIDGDRYSSQSPIKSMVGDAFTQVAQGGIGFHVTNFGYMQLVSCFAVFCSKAFYTTRGGYLSISNSVIDFGDQGFVSDGYYIDPYATGNVSPDFYSTAGSVTVNAPGSGFTVAPVAIIDPPDPNIVGSRQATAEVSIDPILGIINAISITDPGFGYDFQPNITITPDNGAVATVNLAKNLTIDLSNLSSKPQVGSIMILEGDPLGYYISGTLNDSQTFRYDEQKCIRDVKLIVEAVMADIVFGSNYRSVTAGLSYLRSYSSKVTSLQKVQTLDALSQAKLLTVNSTTDSSVQALIADKFDIVIDIIDQGLFAVPEITMPVPENAEVGFPDAAAILEANKEFIQDEIVAWLASTFSFSYDEEQYKQDIGLILDAVLGDMVLGTNHQSRIAAFSYLRSYSLIETEQQKTQTVAGINKTRDLALLLIKDTVSKGIITNNFKIITDVLITSTADKAPSLVYTNPNSTDSGIINAAQQIFTNKNFILSEIVAYVFDNLTPTNYSQALFVRDTEYLIDSLVFDILYEGNSSTVTVAESFFNNNTNLQIPEYESTYERLKEVIGFVIDADDTWTKSVSNTAIQDTALPPGSLAAATLTQELIDIVINTIVADSSGTIPAIVLPTYSKGAKFAFRNTDRVTILNDIDNIEFKVIKFLNETYNGNFTYNETTCRRDIAYIIDALRYDLIYGGNSQSREAGLSYAEGSVIVGEIEETQAAYEHWKEISKSILQNIEITPSPGNETPQNITVSTGNPPDPKAPAAKVATLLQIIIDVIDHGPGYVPEIPTEPEYDSYGDSVFLVERATVLNNIQDIQNDTIFYINSTYGGNITISVFPPIQSVVNGIKASFHNVSTLSSGGTALEYVGAGVTYNALPFFGGEPIPENERIEINNGKAFTVTSDQVGNYRIGEFFTVNALTGEVTINAENLNLSGLASIGPFRRNGIPVGVQLREISDNSALVASTGIQDGNTVPTQRAVSAYVESRYLNKVQGTTPQTVESDITFKKDVEIQGGDLTTDQTTFNLLNTTATTVNFAGNATDVQIGSEIGLTTVNHDLTVLGNTVLEEDLNVNGNTTLGDGPEDITVINGSLSINLTDNTDGALDFKEGINSYIKIDTVNSSEKVIFGTTPIVEILNTTDAINKDTGALTVEGGVGIEKNLHIGVNLTVDGNTFLGSERNDDLLTVAGIVNIDTPDDVGNVFEIRENLSSYVKVDTTDENEYVDFGATPKVRILNITDSLDKDTGALTVEGGVGIERNLTVGIDAKVNRDVVIDRNLAVDGGNLTTIATTFNLVNANATTVNFAGSATTIEIGSATGTTNVNNNLDVDGDVNIDGGDLTVSSATFNLANTIAETVNIAGGATTVNIGSNTGNTNVRHNLIVDFDLTVKGGDLTTDQTTFNLLNTTATTVNFAGAATAIEIGAATGTTNINNDLVVDGDLRVDGGDITTEQTSFNLLTTTALSVSAFTSATTLELGATTGTTSVNNDLTVDGNTTLGNDTNDITTINGSTVFNFADNQVGVFNLKEDINSYFKIDTSNSFELVTFGSMPKVSFLNTTDASNSTTAATMFAGGVAVAKQLWIGTNLFVDGNTVLGDNRVSDSTAINGVVSIDLPDDQTSAFEVTENLSSYVKINTTDSNESVDFGTTPIVRILNNTNSTSKDIGALVVEGGIGVEFNITAGLDIEAGRNITASNNLSVNGGTLSTSSTTFNLVNTNAEAVNFAGASTVVNIGSSTGTTTVKNNLTVDLDLEVKGGDITTNQTTFNLINSVATVVNFAGAGTAITIGGVTGNTTVRNNLTVDLDLEVKGGDVTTNQTTFNLINTVATDVNFAGAATSIEIGASTGTTNVNNNLVVDGDASILGGNLNTSLSTFNLLNTTVTTINAFGAAGVIRFGASNSTVTLDGTTESTNKDTGSLVVEGGAGIEKNLNVGGNLGVTGNFALTGDITANSFNSSKTLLLAPTVGDYTGERLRLYDFANPAKTNYAIGVETSHIWMGVDTNLEGQGFKWYGSTTQVMRLSAAGNLTLVGNATLDGDIAVNGGDITTTATTFNLVNTGATTVNFAGAATAIEIGAATGTTNVNNNLHVDGDIRLGSTVILYNQGPNGFSVRDDFDIANASTQTGYTFSSGTGRTSTILALGVTGEFNNYIGVTGSTASNKLVLGGTGVNTTFEIRNNSGQAPVDLSSGSLLLSVNPNGDLSTTGDLEVKGGDITTNQTTFNLLNTTATAVNFAGAATAIEIGAATGTTNVNNNLTVDLDIAANGGDITTTATAFNLINTNATSVNFAGASTALTIGSLTGTTTLRSADVLLEGDLEVKGGDFTTNQTTFNLLNTIATTVNFAGAATTVEIGAATGTTNVNNNLVVDLDLAVNGGDITTTATTFNLLTSSAETVNFASAGTEVNIGSSTGTTSVKNNLTVDGDLAVKGGDITTDQLTFNLLNTTATTVNFAGFANSIIVGSSTSTTTFNNNIVVAGNLTVSGTTTTVNTEQLLLADNIITVNSNYEGNSPTENAGIEVERGDLTNAALIWDETNDRWTLDNGTGTLRIIHNTGRDVELGVETSGNYVATIAGTVNQVNVANSGTETAAVVLSLPQDIHSGASPQFVNTTLTGDLAVNGGDLTTTAATFNLLDTNATTINAFGAATSITVGAVTGTLTVKNTATIFDSTSHIVIPVGTTAQRPSVPASGMVRYNTELTTFEGYATAWGSLGGVKDVDGDTYIIPELSPGSDEDILYFYNGGFNSATLSATTLALLQNTVSTSTTTGSLVVTGGVGISQNAFIGGTLNATGATTLGDTLAVTGNSTLTGSLAVNSGTVTTTATTVNLVNSTATTVNFAGAATTVEIGSSAGTTNVNNNLVVDLDVEVKGGDITTDQTTFNLLPTTVTTGNLYDVATSVNVSKTAAASSTLTVGPTLSGNKIVVNGTTSGTVDIDSIVTTGTVNLFAGITTGTVNIATTNGCTVNIGGSGSTTNIATLTLTTDLAVEYGGTGQGTFTTNGVIYGNSTSGLLVTAASAPGVSNATTSFGILTTDATNVPVWTDTIDEGEY